jgi:hypothetical protein
VGEVFCVVAGDEKKLTQWVDAKPDRYVVRVGAPLPTPHPRIYYTDGSELSLQHIAGQLLYLPFVYDDPSHPVLQTLARIQVEQQCKVSDFLDQGVQLLTNYRAALQMPTRKALDCFGRLKDFPAIVCGAGPSLTQVVPFLKQYQDCFLIIGCGAGMQALITAGIEPHLAVHVDPDPHHIFTSTQVPLFYQLRTSHAVVARMKGPRFLMAGSGAFPLERWIEDKLGLEDSSDGGYTAVTRGASLAVSLGCKEVYFAGVDFSGTAYAKGVQPRSKDAFIKITLDEGSVVQTRPDWLLAADWLSQWVSGHPEQKWGLALQPNPLMPTIPVVDLHSFKGHQGVSRAIQNLVSSCDEVAGKEAWNEVAANFKKCQVLVDQFLAHFQTIFPKPPSSDATCMKILQEIDREVIIGQVLDPIWTHWEVVLQRQGEAEPDALMIHRILLLKSLSDQFYA